MLNSLLCLSRWRELYTVEEGENLQGLINSAKSIGVHFYYALSPGLDITYSSVKDVASLKRKLDQVGQFGCRKLINHKYLIHNSNCIILLQKISHYSSMT